MSQNRIYKLLACVLFGISINWNKNWNCQRRERPGVSHMRPQAECFSSFTEFENMSFLILLMFRLETRL